jgi:hypothetical protein
MDKHITRILLIIVILILAMLACINGGDGNGSSNTVTTSGNVSISSGPDATATYGAEQFHLQLTAVAKPAP